MMQLPESDDYMRHLNLLIVEGIVGALTGGDTSTLF
jgi:hypothetical protein